MLIHGRPIYKETNYRKRDGMAQESGPAAEPSPPDSGKRGQHNLEGSVRAAAYSPGPSPPRSKG